MMSECSTKSLHLSGYLKYFKILNFFFSSKAREQMHDAVLKPPATSGNSD